MQWIPRRSLFAAGAAVAIAIGVLVPTIGRSADGTTSYKYLSGPIRLKKPASFGGELLEVTVHNVSSSTQTATVTVTTTTGVKVGTSSGGPPPVVLTVPAKHSIGSQFICPGSSDECVLSVQVVTDSALMAPSAAYSAYLETWISIHAGDWMLITS